MSKIKTTILAGLLFILAIFATPGHSAENSCINCHEKLTAFNEKEKGLNEVRIKHLERDVACSIECHEATLDKFAISNYDQWTRSKHARVNVTCFNCHSGDPSSDKKETAHLGVLRSSEISSTVFYRNVPETCGKCHQNELIQFRESIHYQRLKADKQAPTCDTCHNPHEFKVLNINQFKDLCSSCHNNEMKIAPEIPEQAVKAIDNANMLMTQIAKAESAIELAKQQGKDITVAQKELDKAIAIRENLPTLWHNFNLPHFQNITENGIVFARNALMGQVSTQEKPKTPGFGMISALTVLILMILLRRKK